eukprot:TRINITY_DN59045_c0_g1_i1.p1 TRINITY_DN59045_c0_g1~~TRINITY_DN59045_c0_g1_i1.p1  ORF type:complete len:452 (+),score=42.15 TRINITY_DN59045_c0_g1_i1:79-1434(+)
MADMERAKFGEDGEHDESREQGEDRTHVEDHKGRELGEDCEHGEEHDHGEDIEHVEQRKDQDGRAVLAMAGLGIGAMQGVFLLAVMVGGSLAQKALISHTPTVWAARLRCTNCTGDGEDGQCIRENGDVTELPCATNLKYCRLYGKPRATKVGFSLVDVEVEVARTHVEVAYGTSEFEQRCFMDETLTVDQHFVEAIEHHDPWIPYAVVYSVYRLLGLLVSATSHMDLLKVDLGKFGKFAKAAPHPCYLLSMLYSGENDNCCDNACVKKVWNEGMFIFKFLVMPRALFGWMARLEGLEDTDEIIVSRDDVVVQNLFEQFVYYGLWSWFVTMLFGLGAGVFLLGRRGGKVCAVCCLSCAAFAECSGLCVWFFWLLVYLASWSFSFLYSFDCVVMCQFNLGMFFAVDCFQVFFGCLTCLDQVDACRRVADRITTADAIVGQSVQVTGNKSSKV